MPFLLAETFPEIPSNITALGILAFVVWWFVHRLDRVDAAKDKELTDKSNEIANLETKLETLRLDNEEQHKVKHKALNRVAVLEGQIVLIRRAARQCTCGSMDRIRVLLEEDL